MLTDSVNFIIFSLTSATVKKDEYSWKFSPNNFNFSLISKMCSGCRHANYCNKLISKHFNNIVRDPRINAVYRSELTTFDGAF